MTADIRYINFDRAVLGDLEAARTAARAIADALGEDFGAMAQHARGMANTAALEATKAHNALFLGARGTALAACWAVERMGDRLVALLHEHLSPGSDPWRAAVRLVQHARDARTHVERGAS